MIKITLNTENQKVLQETRTILKNEGWTEKIVNSDSVVLVKETTQKETRFKLNDLGLLTSRSVHIYLETCHEHRLSNLG